MNSQENKKKEQMVGVCIVYSDEVSPVDLKTYVWQDTDCPYTLARFKEFAKVFESKKNKKIHSLHRIKTL